MSVIIDPFRQDGDAGGDERGFDPGIADMLHGSDNNRSCDGLKGQGCCHFQAEFRNVRALTRRIAQA
jgi:hypothetical protein